MVESELVPMAAEMGLGAIPQLPLGYGVLTRKYSSTDVDEAAPGAPPQAAAAARKPSVSSTRAPAIAHDVKAVAEELEGTPTQVAIAGTLLNPALTPSTLGVCSPVLLEIKFGALDVVSAQQCARLDARPTRSTRFSHTRSSPSRSLKVMYDNTPIAPQR
jgi:aryl-alcohol dehydrogenase-like predicted oxidoreductase